MKIVTERSSNPNSIIDAILTEIIPEPINVNPFGLMQMLEVIKLRDDEFVLEGFFGFEGDTPLILAVKANHFQSVRLLIEMGANPQSRSKRYSNTPLMVAANQGHTDIVKFFVEVLGVSMQLRNTLGNTACHFAGLAYHKDLFEYLLDQGSNIEENDHQGKSMLMMFCNNETSVMTLISRGAKINRTTKAGKSALDMTVHKNIRRIIKSKAKEEIEISKPKILQQPTLDVPISPFTDMVPTTQPESLEIAMETETSFLKSTLIHPPDMKSSASGTDDAPNEMAVEETPPSSTKLASTGSTTPIVKSPDKGSSSRKRSLEEPSSATATPVTANVSSVSMPPPSPRPSVVTPSGETSSSNKSYLEPTPKRRKRRSRSEIFEEVTKQLAARAATQTAKTSAPVQQTTNTPHLSNITTSISLTTTPAPAPNPHPISTQSSNPIPKSIPSQPLSQQESIETQKLRERLLEQEQTIKRLEDQHAKKLSTLTEELEKLTAQYQEQQIASNEVISTLFEVEIRSQQNEDKMVTLLEEKAFLERTIRQYKNEEYEWKAKLIGLEKEKVQLQKKVSQHVDQKDSKQRIRDLEKEVHDLENDLEITTSRYEKSCKQMIELLHMTTNKLYKRKMDLRLEELFQANRKHQLCFNCQHRLKDTANVPCGHVSYCQDCTDALKEEKHEVQCLVCKVHVTSFLKLLDSSL